MTRYALVLTAFAATTIAVADMPSDLSAEQWREDIDYWEAKIREMHLDPFHTVSAEDFDAHLAMIRENAGTWPDYAVALDLIHAAATIGDGHTYLYDGGLAGYFTSLPFAAEYFDDGLFITRAMPGHEDLIGLEVLAIETTPIATVIEAAKPYAARDNEWGVLARFPWLTYCPEFLHWKGFAEDSSRVTLTLRDASNEERELTLEPVSGASHREWRAAWKPDSSKAMYRRNTSTTYWKTYLEDANAVYMQFNAVRNMDGGPHLARFSRDLIEFIDEREADYLIVDVRHNGGGDGNLLKPLIRRIAAHPRINRPGHLYVLSSRYTFSAALMFLARMERETHVRFAGEPSSGKPNSYSEYNAIELPNSGLHGSISTIFHQEGLPDDTRECIDVHIPAPLTAADWFGNRDPVLDAVLAEIQSNR